MKSILCLLGIHKWKYASNNDRCCEKCNIWQAKTYDCYGESWWEPK